MGQENAKEGGGPGGKAGKAGKAGKGGKAAPAAKAPEKSPEKAPEPVAETGGGGGGNDEDDTVIGNDATVFSKTKKKITQQDFDLLKVKRCTPANRLSLARLTMRAFLLRRLLERARSERLCWSAKRTMAPCTP